jgi:hypothetical protein
MLHSTNTGCELFLVASNQEISEAPHFEEYLGFHTSNTLHVFTHDPNEKLAKFIFPDGY